MTPTLAPAPCHCGAPIPANRRAYCSPPCKWTDTDHGADDYDREDDAA